MKFEDLNLEPEVLQGLDAMNFKEATPVQEATIPVVLDGKDLIACAQTGTGKTAAYILPLLNLLTRRPSEKDLVRAIVIAPTRELAQQIDMQFEGFSYFLPISTFVVAGGGDGAQWDQQKRGLQMGADVMIATPGRLISHLLNTKVDLSGSNISYSMRPTACSTWASTTILCRYALSYPKSARRCCSRQPCRRRYANLPARFCMNPKR